MALQLEDEGVASTLIAAASSLLDKMHLARHAYQKEKGVESEELTKQTLQVLYILIQVCLPNAHHAHRPVHMHAGATHLDGCPYVACICFLICRPSL